LGTISPLPVPNRGFGLRRCGPADHDAVGLGGDPGAINGYTASEVARAAGTGGEGYVKVGLSCRNFLHFSFLG